jgi:hypothetical protein
MLSTKTTQSRIKNYLEGFKTPYAVAVAGITLGMMAFYHENMWLHSHTNQAIFFAVDAAIMAALVVKKRWFSH